MLKAPNLRTAIIALSCSLSLAAHAFADDIKQLNVPPGDLTKALETLIKQSGVELVYQTEQLEGLRTQGVRGTLSPHDAILELLEGTPLELRTDASGAMFIAAPAKGGPATQASPGGHDTSPAAPTKAKTSTAEERISPQYRLAQATSSNGQVNPFESPESPGEQSSALAASLEEVVVTGTRRSGVKAIDSAAPVEIVDASSMGRVGQPDLIQALAQSFPGFTAQAFDADTANLTLALSLRGLSPNNTLVLIDGKRRHTTANLAIDPGAGAFQGGASADLSFIPVGAIDHVEILEDGAAAQYGSDAVAGVVNIILKKDRSAGSLTLSTGQYYVGDGLTPDIAGDIGFRPTASSYFDVAIESRYHDHTDRGAIDPRVIGSGLATEEAGNPINTNILQAPGYPFVNRIEGDARYTLNVLEFAAGNDLGDGLQLYSFGTYGHKQGAAFENYRLPSKLPALYPYGFSPNEEIRENDYSLTGAIRGKALSTWNWDLSTTYGKDRVSLYTTHSGNVSLYDATGSTPTSAHDGDLIATQWTSNLDVNRDYSIGLASPLNVAFGVEYRHETYEIAQGDYAATYVEGLQSYPGFTASDTGTHGRNNYAGYLDFAVAPLTGLKVDIAGRYEHFSDFGNTQVGKFTTRYDFTPTFAARGTISSGFRAPTLAEEYYSSTSVNSTSAFVQLPPNSPGARLIGVDGLKPEKSKNYSVGLVTHPTSKLTATLDLYQIDIRDRIVGSGAVFASGFGGTSPAVTAAIIANGNVLDPAVVASGNTGIEIFANGLSTRTRGAELAASYASNLGEWGLIDWSLSGNSNTTSITHINAPLVALSGQALYSQAAISDITTASPKFRVNVSALYTVGKWAINLRETLFGPSSEYELGDDNRFYQTTIPTAAITDLNIDYRITARIKLSIGANNLFDKRPPQYNAAREDTFRTALDNSLVQIYPNFSPYGIDGGYYYGKITYGF